MIQGLRIISLPANAQMVTTEAIAFRREGEVRGRAGVFIGGDYASQYAHALRSLLRDAPPGSITPLHRECMESLLRSLESCDEEGRR